jgi:hypothetical protein
MGAFGQAAIWGFLWGFCWGIGCSLAIMYSLYLTAYRKAVKDSLKAVKPKRYTRVLDMILAKRAKTAAQTPPL